MRQWVKKIRTGGAAFLPLLLLAQLGACAVTAQSQVEVEPVYVVYRIRVTNSEFPPDSYRVKVNCMYDTDRLYYVKSEHTLFRYREPVIVPTEKGLHIDFKSLPTSYTGPLGEMALYFIPLAEGTGTIAGELAAKESEIYLGPRHTWVTKRLPSLEYRTVRAFRWLDAGGSRFLDELGRLGIAGAEDFLKGRHARIFIPAAVSGDRAEGLLREVMSGQGFRETGSIWFPDGMCRTFLKAVPEKRQVVEVRGTVENSEMGRHLHLAAFGIQGVDELFDTLEARYRGLLGE
ncbi:MAG: hypothetical protein JXA20_12450 [Spirochaetes bacterium]|nr:hypothetical protein [Spirochaetota bacterium]